MDDRATIEDSYWCPSHERMSSSFSTQHRTTHFEEALSQDALDYLVLQERLSDITQKLEKDQYVGELIPRSLRFRTDENGRHIPAVFEQTKARLEIERRMISDGTLPSNPISKVCSFFFLF